MTTFYIVRHGESVANRDGICGTDSPLTDKGIEQAHEAKELLKDVKFDDAYSSNYGRSIDTAKIILGREFSKDNQLELLRERNFRSMDGHPEHDWMVIKDDWESKYKDLPFKERSHIKFSAEDIETDGEMVERILGELEKIAKQNPGKTFLVGSHAGPARTILMQLGFAEFLTVGSFRNAGYVKLGYDNGEFKILDVNGVQKPWPSSN